MCLRLAEASIDGRVLGFTVGVSVLCSLLFGLVPALYASRIDLNDALKRSGARSVSSGGASHLRGALVTAEIALSVMLLSGAGLLIKSFIALNHVALGFRPERVLLMKTTLPVSGPDGGQRASRFFKQLLSDVSSLPGVSAAGATMGPPGQVESAGAYWIDHLPKPLTWQGEELDAVYLGGDSRHLRGSRHSLSALKRGRDFDDSDARGAPLSAVINEALAKEGLPRAGPDWPDPFRRP